MHTDVHSLPIQNFEINLPFLCLIGQIQDNWADSPNKCEQDYHLCLTT